jgi:hypothetical protein
MTPQKLILQTRRPSRDYSDPGAVEFGWWIVSDGAVHLCDENGTKTGQSRTLTEGQDPKILAIGMPRGRIGVRKSDFSRKLRYPVLRY